MRNMINVETAKKAFASERTKKAGRFLEGNIWELLTEEARQLEEEEWGEWNGNPLAQTIIHYDPTKKQYVSVGIIVFDGWYNPDTEQCESVTLGIYYDPSWGVTPSEV